MKYHAHCEKKSIANYNCPHSENKLFSIAKGKNKQTWTDFLQIMVSGCQSINQEFGFNIIQE